MPTTAEKLLRTWLASSRDSEIDGVVSEICGESASLLDVVKALGEFLTAEDDELRTKGVDFLSAVLDKVPPEKVNHQAVRALTTFYCGKLDDIETVIPALKGLSSLARLPSTAGGEALDIVRGLISRVKMKTLAQSTRFLVFTIVDTLIARHRDALQSMGDEFLTGYLTLAEGEKDPRNLMLAFAIARVLIIEFDIAKHIEGFFNTTFCYFPITFRPPPNDPYGITTDNLRTALCNCLNATSAFGPLAMPVFLDKLTAGSPVTKRDTLRTMAECLPVYGFALAREFAPQLWNSLKLEVFHPTDPETEGEALKTTQVVVRIVHADEVSYDESLQGFARDVCEECLRILQEPEKSRAQPAIKILCTLVHTTPSVSRHTLSQAVPYLVKLFLNPEEAPHRAKILSFLSDLVSTANEPSSAQNLPRSNDRPPHVLPYKDEILGVVMAGLKTDGTAHAALDCIRSLVSTRPLLSDDEIGFVVHNINGILQADSRELEDARDLAIEVLASISLSTPKHIEVQTLPLLFSFLPDKAPLRNATAERVKYWRALSGLSKLCRHPELFEILVIRLTTKLDIICATPSGDATDNELNAAYAHSILTTIAATLAFKVDNSHADVPKYIDRLVPRLLHLLIFSSVVTSDQLPIAADLRIVKITARILTLVAETLPAGKQKTYVVALYSTFLTGDVNSVASGHQKIPEHPKFFPFQPAAPLSQKNLLPLLAASTMPLRLEVGIPVNDINELLEEITVWSIHEAANDMQREAAWCIIASIINKHTPDVGEFLSNKLAAVWAQSIADSSLTLGTRRHAMTAWSWITKALVVRNHGKSTEFADRLTELFCDENLSLDAARLLGGLGGSDCILTKRNHAVLKMFHSQRFFDRILPRLVIGASSPQLVTQNANLAAIACLLSNVPKALYLHEMPSLTKLLLCALELPDAVIRTKVIDTFLSVADAKSPCISEHISTLVSAMLRNGMLQEVTSMRLRMSALRYLALLPSMLRYDVLHPYKAKVLRELANVLDDPRRSVRKEAVAARANWFKCNG